MAQTGNIFESDLQMFRTTLFRDMGACVVYDPDEMVKKNADSDLIFLTQEKELELISERGKEVALFFLAETKSSELLQNFSVVVGLFPRKMNGYEKQVLLFFEGKYDTIRLAFSSLLTSPLYYSIKGSHFEYPKYKKIIDAFLMKMGWYGLISRGKFFLYHQSIPSLSNPYFISSEEFVFTKMASIFSVQNSQILEEKKVCDSDFARTQLDNEAHFLHQLHLEDSSFKKVQIPKVLSYRDDLVLSANRPPNAEMSDQLEDLHIEALDEIYQKNLGEITSSWFLDSISAINTIKAFKLILQEGLHPNGISGEHVEELSIDLISLIQKLDKNTRLRSSLYHGNFEPSNCLILKDVLYLNNFQKSKENCPLLFDVFHYLFYLAEREEMPNMGFFDDQMKYAFKNKSILKMIDTYQINFKEHLALFHIYHIIGKMEQFLKQRFINPNVNFTLVFYRQALERMNALEF